MAKITTVKKTKDAAPAKSTKAKAEAAPAEDKGYGVNYLAEQLGIEPFSVRVKLRDHEIPKNGNRYQWASRKEADKVVAAIRSTRGKKDDSED